VVKKRHLNADGVIAEAILEKEETTGRWRGKKERFQMVLSPTQWAQLCSGGCRVKMLRSEKSEKRGKMGGTGGGGGAAGE